MNSNLLRQILLA